MFDYTSYQIYRAGAKYRAAQFKRGFFVLLPAGCPDLPLDDMGDFEALEYTKDTPSDDSDSKPDVNLKHDPELAAEETYKCAADFDADVDVDSDHQPVSRKYAHTYPLLT